MVTVSVYSAPTKVTQYNAWSEYEGKSEPEKEPDPF